MSLAPQEKPLGTNDRRAPDENSSAREAGIKIGTEHMLADLGNTVAPAIRIPENSEIQKMNATTSGRVANDKVKINTVKLNFDFKTGAKGEGFQPHRRTSEVALKETPEEHIRLMQEKRVFIAMYGHDTPGGRFEGEIDVELPLVIADSGDIPGFESVKHEKFDIAEKFKNFGGLLNYPNGDMAVLLAKDHGGSSFEYETETDGKRNDETGIFVGTVNYKIKFAHSSQKINDAMKKAGNTYKPREEKLHGPKSDEVCRECPPPRPKDEPKPAESGEKAPALGRSGFQMYFNVTRDDVTGVLKFEPKELPAFLNGAQFEASFPESETQSDSVFVRLKITVKGESHTYQTKGVVPLARKAKYGFEGEFLPVK